MSFLSGGFNKRGYYLAVQPVKREGNCKSMLAFSGTKALIEEVKRFRPGNYRRLPCRPRSCPFIGSSSTMCWPRQYQLTDQTPVAMARETNAGLTDRSGDSAAGWQQRTSPGGGLTMTGTQTPLAITLQRQGISASLRTQPHALMTPGPGKLQPRIQSRHPSRAIGNSLVSGPGHRGETRKSFRQRMRRPSLLVPAETFTGRDRSRSRTWEWQSALPKRN